MVHERTIDLLENQLEYIEEGKNVLSKNIENLEAELEKEKSKLHQLEIEKIDYQNTINSLKERE